MRIDIEEYIERLKNIIKDREAELIEIGKRTETIVCHNCVSKCAFLVTTDTEKEVLTQLYNAGDTKVCKCDICRGCGYKCKHEHILGALVLYKEKHYISGRCYDNDPYNGGWYGEKRKYSHTNIFTICPTCAGEIEANIDHKKFYKKFEYGVFYKGLREGED